MGDRMISEAFLKQLPPGTGMFGREPLPLMAGLWDDNGTLKALAAAAAGTVGFAYMTGDTGLTDDILGLKWGASSDQTDFWVYSWQVPWDYKRDSGQTGTGSSIYLAIAVRKLDAGGATDNSDLQLRCATGWHSPALSNAGVESDGDAAFNVLSDGYAVAKLLSDIAAGTAAGSCYTPALAAAGSEGSFRLMLVDVMAGMTAAQKAALKPGARLTFKLYPHETVGASQSIEMASAEVWYTRHLQPENDYIKGRSSHS